MTFSSETQTADDGRTRWQKDGTKTVYSGKQFWWSKHEVGFKELLDTRGKHDVASPLGEWTKVECICDGSRITIKINGTVVNECYDAFPSEGRILLENEKNKIYFRNFEIRALKASESNSHLVNKKRPSKGNADEPDNKPRCQDPVEKQ